MTPSAARNILDCICWKPQMRWVVTRIAVLKPIRFQSIRRNEVQSKVSPAAVKKWIADPSTFEPLMAGAGEGTDATPRNSLVLRDVSYVIDAYPHVYEPNGEDTPIKYMAMFNRRVEKGQCFSRPALGMREFPARFEFPSAEDHAIPVSMEIGTMLYDIIFRPEGNQALFFRASLQDGVLDAHPERAIADSARREELLKCSYKH
jgi:CRISPR-associated protein Cas5d